MLQHLPKLLLFVRSTVPTKKWPWEHWRCFLEADADERVQGREDFVSVSEGS